MRRSIQQLIPALTLALCALAPAGARAQPAAEPSKTGQPSGSPAASPASAKPGIASPSSSGSQGGAQPEAPAAAPEDGAASTSPEQAAREVLSTRARQLQALLRGKLDPSVDADDLLRWNLDDGPAAELWVEAEKPEAERQLPEAPEARAFVEALGRYLALPAPAQARVLTRHRKKHAAFEATSQARAQMQQELERLREGNDKLAQWLAGELDPAKSVKGLLRVDLVPAPLPALPGADGEALREELAAARAQRAQLIESYASRPSAARAALHEAHKDRKEAARADAKARAEREAEEERRRARELETRQAAVERERAEALEAAALADSEAQRLFANERARLLGETQALTLVEAQLEERRENLEVPRERALAFQRRVQTLFSRTALESNLEPEADRLYAELRGALSRARNDLRGALSAWRSSSSIVPEPEPGPDTSLLDPEDQVELSKLQAKVDRRRAELRMREHELLQQYARALNDAVSRMNRSRLELLPLASHELRSDLLGFGPGGVEQLKRELDQLVLSATYHLTALPRDVQRLYESARRSTYSIVIVALQFLALLAAFRLWRVSGEGVLLRIEERARRAPLQTSLMRRLALGAWYLRRVRRPLEWLLLFTAVFHLVGRIDALPEIQFVWLACLWVTIGWAAVLLLDALAVRHHLRTRAGYETPELRIRSLRVIALMVVAGGLLLAWTMEGVGQGTVYRWVKVLCGVLATPLAVMLAHWWREPVRRRLEDLASDASTVRWVLRNQTRPKVYLTTAVGALYLTGQGILRVLMRQAARFEWMQRALAYLFRVQVERQAQAQRERKKKVPLASIAPLAMEPTDVQDEFLEDVAAEQLDIAMAQAQVGSSLTIVVGERGIGRSTFLKRLTSRVGEDLVLRVSCPSGEMADLEAELTRRAIEQTGAVGDKDSVQALAQSPVRVVCVDDVQRMVQPAVGGLEAFERLVDLAQRHDDRIAWVFSITSSAWAVVSRARESVAGFDRILKLPSWSEKQIGVLLRRRTEAEGIEPSFEDLTVPRQLDVEETMDPVERATLAYYRILWDFSDGNPSVALHFWRQSLFRDADGRITVGLFETPSPRDIEALPSSLHFMLRAVVQLDRATPQAVADCTAFPLDVVRDGLELAIRRGYVERNDGELSITLGWFRTVSTVLRRQHLLVT